MQTSVNVNCQEGVSMTASRANGTVLKLGMGVTSDWFHLRAFSAFFFFFFGSSDLVGLLTPRFISTPSST